MAMGVVDPFEMIDVADTDGEYPAMTTGTGQLFVEMILETNDAEPPDENRTDDSIRCRAHSSVGSKP
jgi:hypothetical protein